MGRIRSMQVKRYAKEYLQKFGNRFNNDFDSNKSAMAQVSELKSKKLRNVIAGYIVKLVKQDKY